jgi:hypothetical protein
MNLTEYLDSNFIRRRNPRAIFGAGLLLTSLIAALALTSAANRSVLVWSAKGELAVGDVIASSDLRETKVMLPENSKLYLSSGAKLIGSIVTRKIGAGELIPTDALSRTSKGIDLNSVPLKVAKNDLPGDLQTGQSIDLYILPISGLASQKSSPTNLVAANLSVEGIDQKSRDLGGDVGVVLKVPQNLVEELLSNVASGRIVLVRSAI